MERTTLGRTGLEVSVAGLGCGGHSRLGQAYGHSFEQSVAVVRAALDEGVNLIDTAAAYGTEEIVGAAIAGRRDEAVTSTKIAVIRPGTPSLGDDYLSGTEFIAQVENNLQRLGTDYIDILHLHGVAPSQYAYCREELVPALETLRDHGKIRFLGLTERFIHDTRHDMLQDALRDDVWDVVMAGFNMINPSARHRVFERTREQNIGTLIMFAVRRALGSRDAQIEIVSDLVRRGEIDASAIDMSDPFGFLTQTGAATSVIEAAYRFCRHEPGADVVLTGTGSVAHLKSNIGSITNPELPDDLKDLLRGIFGDVDSVSGN